MRKKSLSGCKAIGEARMLLDSRGTLNSDTSKGGRVNGKESMTRRRYQEGCLLLRGRVGRKVWVARWREDMLQPDGTCKRIMRSQVLGPIIRIPAKREARQLMNSLLRPTNQGLRRVQATMTFGDFARKWEDAILPTYRCPHETSIGIFFAGIWCRNSRNTDCATFTHRTCSP